MLTMRWERREVRRRWAEGRRGSNGGNDVGEGGRLRGSALQMPRDERVITTTPASAATVTREIP